MGMNTVGPQALPAQPIIQKPTTQQSNGATAQSGTQAQSATPAEATVPQASANTVEVRPTPASANFSPTNSLSQFDLSQEASAAPNGERSGGAPVAGSSEQSDRTGFEPVTATQNESSTFFDVRGSFEVPTSGIAGAPEGQRERGIEGSARATLAGSSRRNVTTTLPTMGPDAAPAGTRTYDNRETSWRVRGEFSSDADGSSNLTLGGQYTRGRTRGEGTSTNMGTSDEARRLATGN